MISSKMFTMTLKYKLDNSNNFDNACEELKSRLLGLFGFNHFMQTMHIISVENEVTIDSKDFPKVDIVIMMYATVEDLRYVNSKLLKAYMDLYANVFQLSDNGTATLIKRRAY